METTRRRAVLLFWIVLVAPMVVSCSSTSRDGRAATDVRPLETLGDLAVGESANIHNFWVHCGVKYLDRPINETLWVAVDADDSAIDWIPSSWEPFVNDIEEIDLVVTLAEPERLEVSPSLELEPMDYQPTTENFGCD